VRSAEVLSPGNKLTLEFAHGGADATVTTVRRGEKREQGSKDDRTR
jgi:hypothetical protein